MKTLMIMMMMGGNKSGVDEETDGSVNYGEKTQNRSLRLLLFSLLSFMTLLLRHHHVTAGNGVYRKYIVTMLKIYGSFGMF